MGNEPARPFAGGKRSRNTMPFDDPFTSQLLSRRSECTPTAHHPSWWRAALRIERRGIVARNAHPMRTRRASSVRSTFACRAPRRRGTKNKRENFEYRTGKLRGGAISARPYQGGRVQRERG